MCFNKYKYKRIWCENIGWLSLVYRIIIDWSLQTNCIDILISSLLFDFNNDVLINSGVDQVRKLVKADKMAFIVLGFITRFPSGRCVVCFSFDQPTVASDNRLSYACILLFPTGTKVSRGVPDFPLAMTKYFVPNEIWTPHCNDIKHFVPNEIRWPHCNEYEFW